MLEIPSLRLRKDIWTHFPVCLIKLPPSSDGHDRYAVQWHQKNLQTWCQKIPQYEQLVQMRLLKALAMSDRWTLEVPRCRGDLCVISMKFSEEPKQFHTLPDMYATSPDIHTVEDIKAYFPICWKTRKNAHSLEFHNTFVRALAQKYGVDDLEIRRITLERLMPILQTHWTVVPPTKTTTTEICTIHR
jgi:hypothetical protein